MTKHVRFALLMALFVLLFFVYEAVKEYYFPHASKWESHFITIVFASFVCSSVAYVFSKREAGLEEARISAEIQHRLVLESISDAVFLTDNALKFTFICPNADVIFRYSPSEIKDMDSIDRLLGQDFFDRHTLEREGELQNMSIEVRDKHGGLHELLVNVKQVDLGESRLLFSCRDATQYRQTQRVLLSQERRFRQIVNDIPLLICRFEPGGVLTMVNQAYCSYFGMSEQQLMGRNFLEFSPPESHGAVYEHLASFSPERPVFSLEHKVIDPAGRLRTQRWTDRAFFNEFGEPIIFQSVGEDVTERREAEQRLARSEALFRTVVGGSKDAIVAIDETGMIIVFNQAAVDMFGILEEDALGSALDPLVPEQYREQHRQYIHDFMAGKSSRGVVGKTLELDAVRNGEEVFPIELSLASSQSANTCLAVAVIRDITERKKMEAQLQERAFAAEAGNRAKTEFLTMMSHELRTPLNGIMGFLQVIESIDDKQRLQEYVKAALQSAQALLTLLNDALDMAKAESGRLQILHRPLSLREVVDSVMVSFAPSAQEKGVFLEAELSENLNVPLYGDPQRIRQVLYNLVGNAVKFTDIGAVRLSVYELCPEKSTEDTLPVHFVVADTGIGIPEAVIDTVCQPFSQTEDVLTRHRGGSGLGLSIVSRLVQLMDGSMSISSKEGEGTEVHVILPVAMHAPSYMEYADGL